MKKILIVDDHEVVRAGVMRIVEQPGTIFGEASNADQALKLVREEDWDLAVLDLSLGDRSGLELLKELKQTRAKLPILILSMHSEVQYARRAFQAGAAGYITKDSPSEELVKAVNRVIEGGRYINSATAERLALELERGLDRPSHHALSDREFEVMRLIASGKAVGEPRSFTTRSGTTWRIEQIEALAGFDCQIMSRNLCRVSTDIEISHRLT
jgi:two-component system invasion response regulator UvrY